MRKGTKTVLIIAAAAAVAAGGFFGIRHLLGGGPGKSGEDVAYVDTVANFMGISGSSGMVNRFAGIVESQETWSVNQNQEYTVEEIFVTVGQEVKEGDPLFKYDVDKFQSDLTQAEIDLERLNNEMNSMLKIKEQLEKDEKKASSSEKANYTIQIQEQELNIKQKQIDIDTKQLDIDKLHDNIEHATVTSGLTGVIKSINKDGSAGGYGGNEEDNAFITVMQIGDYRVKGTINEQNMYDIYAGEPVIVYSRADSKKTWRGTIERIDTENTVQSRVYYDESANQSSKYPFYVQLDDSTGLILGQHVYMEPDLGQGEEPDDTLYVTDYLIDMTDPEHPFVWKEDNDKLIKQPVTLGEYQEELMQYAVTEGLAAEDRIAVPEERLREGMPTADMADMQITDDGGMMEEDMMDGGMMDEDMMDGGMMEEDMMDEGMMDENGEGGMG